MAPRRGQKRLGVSRPETSRPGGFPLMLARVWRVYGASMVGDPLASLGPNRMKLRSPAVRGSVLTMSCQNSFSAIAPHVVWCACAGHTNLNP